MTMPWFAARRIAAPLLLALPFALAGIAVAQEQAAPESAPDPAAEYRALNRDLNQAIKAWQDALRKEVEAAQAAGKPFAFRMAPPTKELVDRALTLAKRYENTEDAVRFLGFVLKNASNEREAVRHALATLGKQHATSPSIGGLLRFCEGAERLGGQDAVRALLDAVIAANEDADAEAQALFQRGRIALQRATTDEQRAAAKADLARGRETAQDEDLKARIDGVLFELDHLQVGCTAPEIAGKDTDGTAFALSDYRGKVILLDFWGFW